MMTLNAGAQCESVCAQRRTFGWPKLLAALGLATLATSAAVVGQTVTSQTLFVVEIVTPTVQSQFPQRNAVSSYLISQGSFDPDNNGLFEHPSLLRQALSSHVPENYNGPVCLDWEGQGMARLAAATTSSFHRDGVKAFIDLITLARELRPQAQFGFYNLPMNEYWNRNTAWRNQNLALQTIIDASDCLFPSVYDFYKTGQFTGHFAGLDFQYVRECVGLALEMANGKPVLPYVSPRYHVSNPAYGLRMIPVEEFKPHLRAAFDVEFRGDRIDGLAWWGADRWFRWLGEQNLPQTNSQYWLSWVCRNVFDAEIPSNSTDDAHFTNIHRRTLRQIADVITDEL